MCDCQKELFELKQILLEVLDNTRDIKPALKSKVLMTEFAKEIDISKQTLYAHLRANYQPEVDFYKENNKILLNVNILQSIRGYYAK